MRGIKNIIDEPSKKPSLVTTLQNTLYREITTEDTHFFEVKCFFQKIIKAYVEGGLSFSGREIQRRTRLWLRWRSELSRNPEDWQNLGDQGQ